MDKVTKFLEQYVQWLVLTLALAWVSWQAYSYVVKEPLATTIGMPPVTVTPATIDQEILKGSTQKLKSAMAGTGVEAPKLAPVLDIVTRALDEKDANAMTLVTLGGSSAHAPYVVGGSTDIVENKVKELPNPPVATPDSFSSHWTVIMAPAATQPPAAPAAPGAAPVAVQPVTVRQDVPYISIKFIVDAAQLTAQITKKYGANPNVPPNLLLAEFVRVDLLRQEQQADGSWSAPAVIPGLPIHEIMPDPADANPPLTSDALKKALYDYKQWMEANQDVILHPAFYQTAADAMIWVPPGGVAPAPIVQPGQPVVDHVFDPSRDTPKTPAEMLQKQQYIQNQKNLVNQNYRRGPGARGPDGRPIGPGNLPPPGYRGNIGGGPGVPGFMQPRGGPGYVQPGGAVPPPMVNPNAGVVPGVGLPNQNVEILVHDVTIQEGKTYRYAVRYKLFNPLWDVPKLATDEVAGTFDVNSPDPANPKAMDALKKADPKFDPEKLWTAAISVDPLAHVFVTHIDAFGNKREADFVVFTWKNGRWTETAVKKQTPGDPISANKAPTPWTVVDVRKDAHTNETYVILMDDHGVLTRRDEASDAQSEQLKKLRTESGAAAVAK